jgi:DNA-binding transcriptional regulator YiaG
MNVNMTPSQLKQARITLGLTQAAMAKAMGIGTRKWERWEGGHSPISPEGARLVEMLVDLKAGK